MAYRLELPDGSFVTVQDDAKPRAAALAEAKAKFPDAFPAPPGVGQQLLGLPGEIGKGFIRGLTVDPASGLASLGYTGARAAGAELTPFEQTGVGKGLASAQRALAPSDEGLITQFGGGLGSLLSFIPGGLLKGGIGLATKLTQAGGVGSEEARARAEEARVMGEADATAGQQFMAQLGGTGVGLTELAPLKFLTGPIEQILRGVPKSQADIIAPTLFNSGKRMLVTGGIEGFQEGMANIAQDLIAKGIYNPNLEVGESALGDAAMGASVGAFAQGAIDLATRGKRRQLYEQVKQQEEFAKQAEEQRIAAEQQAALAAQERQQQQLAMQALGGPRIDPETGQPILLLGGPAPEVNLQDPLGVRFGEEDLGPKIVSGINRARKAKGLPPTKEFTIEDLYEAGTEKDAPFVSEMLARKIGFDPASDVSPQGVIDIALSKNIDVEAPGFADFLRRTTGSPDIGAMSAPQLFAAQQSLSALPNFTEPTQLPTGSGATVFDEKTYKKTVDGLKKTVLNSGPLGRSQVLEEVKGFSGLTETRDAERLLETALRRGDLSASPTQGLVGTSINISLPSAPGVAGPDIRRGDYMDSEVTGYEVTSEDGKFKQVRPNLTAAENAAAAANEKRLNAVEKLNDELNRTQLVLDSNQEKLTELEEVGNQNTPQYKKIESNVKNLTNKINRLNEKIQSASQPLQVKAKQTPRSRAGFTLFENGQPVGTYPTQEDAEIAAVRFRTDEELDGIINAAPRTAREGALEQPFGEQPVQRGTVSGGMPRRLVDEAVKEKERRYRTQAGLPPPAAPVKIKITGDAVAAAERLRAAGLTVRFAPEVEKEIPEINKKLRAVLDRLGLKEVRLNIVESMKVPGFAIYDQAGKLRAFLKKVAPGSRDYQQTMETVEQARSQGMRVEEAVASGNGSYAAKLIEIALDAENPILAARHEAIHALKELGFFTPEQWRVLENKAKSEWIELYKIKSRYSDLDAEGQLEEAIADAFSFFELNQPPVGTVGNLFRKVKAFFEALGNAFRGSGFQTARDVFTRVEEGRLTGPGEAVTGEQKFSLTLEQTADVTPLGVQQARVYEKELDALIKKIGDRIVGMKSGETLDNVRKAVKKLQSYTAQGLKGKDWYENSAKAVLDAFNGDPVLAEKFFQIIAITSANTEVAANFTKASNAWTQFANGKPIKVGTENENKKINALLNFGEDWEGRKTNTFYTNLMEAMEGKDSGRSTIDLHMTRMLFDKDAPTEAQYILAENMVRLLASKIGLPARQVQAASWVTQKAKTIFDEYRKKGWKKGLNDDQLREFAFERAVADYSHLMKARVKQLPVTEALKELSSNIRTRVQNITGEVIPSVKTEMAEVESLLFKDKEKLTKQVAKSKIVEQLANTLGIESKVRVTIGSGAYEGKVNPNLIVQVVNDDPAVAQRDALDLANAMSYVFKQDSTPFFRADPALVDQEQMGYRFKFAFPLTPTQQKNILSLLNNKFGEGVGFTKVRANEIVIINYRGADGTPFLASDTDFVIGLDEVRDGINDISSIESQEVFGAQSEYPYHEWKTEPTGISIVQGIQDRRPERPNLQRGLDNLRESFVSDARRAVREAGREPKFSLRLDELVGGPGIGSGISIREQQPTAQSFDAVHYGKQRVNTLLGSMYGTGIKGAEARRVFASEDPRIQKRAYFYIPMTNGRMPMPEAGLGNQVHVQRLNNLLGPSPEMQALVNATRGPDGRMDENAFESAVIDAGYDGYAVPDMGMAVVLGADVPVIARPQEVEKDKIQIGDRKYSLRPIETPEFKQWFGSSQIVNADSTPKVMYHGTARDIGTFVPKQANAIFLTDSPKFAEGFTSSSEDFMVPELFASLSRKEQFDVQREAEEIVEREGGDLQDEINTILKNRLPSRANIMPLYVRAENPFDYENPDHLQKLVKQNSDIGSALGKIRNGSWSEIESERTQKAIIDAGFDSFYVREGGRKNLAVYNPNQVKSAIGNIGTFSRDNDDIRYSIALGSLDPRTALIPDIGGNPDGSLGLAPEKVGFKPIRMLIGTHNDIEDKGFGANHILTRVLSDPNRMAELDMSAKEVLERIVRTAQKTAQNYSRIYRDPKTKHLAFYTPNNTLIVSQDRDQWSIVSMFKVDRPDQKFGQPIWQGRAPAVQQFVGKITGTDVEAREGRIQPKAKTEVTVKPKRVYTPSEIEQIAVSEPKKGTLTLNKKMSLRLPDAKVNKFFDDQEKIPMSEDVETIRDSWIGGVSGIGERDLAYYLNQVDGGPEYIQRVQDLVRKDLGDSFKGYRLMSQEELEELQTGSMGTQLASISLVPETALAIASIPQYARRPKGDLVVVELDLTPEHVQMVGHPPEKELVIDYGVGYNMTAIEPMISPVRFSLREFSLDDLPQDTDRAVYTLPAGTKLYHGSNKDTASEIKKAGHVLLADPPYKSSGGYNTEGYLVWFGDKETAEFFATGPEGQAREDQKEPGEVFETVTGEPLKLIHSTQYKLDADQAKKINDFYEMPDYKLFKAGDSLSSVSWRVTSNTNALRKAKSYRAEGAGTLYSVLKDVARLLGFDGYYYDNGIALPAEKGISLGLTETGEFVGKPMQRFSLSGDLKPVNTDSAEFKRFFKNSKIVGKDGKPKVMYHGTDQDISEFVPGESGIIFVSPDPDFAGTFTKYSEERSLKKLARELDEKPEQKRKVLESAIETSMADDSLTNVDSPYYQDLAKAGFIKDLNQYTKDFWIDKFMSQRMSENMTSVGIRKPLEQLMLSALKTGRNILPVYVSAQNPFDYDNRSHVIQLMKKLASMDSRYTSGTPTARAIRDDILNGRWQEIENTDVQDAIKELGFDSFYAKEQDTKNLGLFSPNQIKSAVSNTGEFSLADPRIQYSIAIPSELEPSGGRDNMIYLLQDKNIDLKRVQQGIVKAGKDILDRFNAYMKEELFHGRSATRVRFFMDRELRPLLQKMEAAGISVEQMDDYLLARHAKEANAYIRKINPDPKQNSGMTDKEADDYMASLPPPRRAALEKLAKEIDGITKGTRQLMVEYGLEDQKTINQWEKTYKNYVPLFREEIEGDEETQSYMPISIGRGYQIRGSTIKRRMGSARKVSDILANIALQRERIIVRGEKNRVGNALYGLVLDNPDKDFWAVINPEKMSKQAMRIELLNLGINPDAVDDMVNRPIKKKISPTTGLVSYEVPPMWKNAPNLFITRINGEDRIIGFNKSNERSMRMAATLKNLDAQQQGEAVRMMGTAGDYYRKSIEGAGKVTRYFAQINTQYNPAFGVYNLLRDIGGAVLNLQTTPLKGQEAKVVSDALVALKSVYRDLRRQRQGLDADSKWAQIFEEFELEGGKTGYRDLFETRESRAEALQQEIQDFNKGNLRSKGKAIMGWLSDFNDSIENAIRVSVYKNALDKGLSKERAASLAKNITVNFNRTGAVSRNFQTLFAFFNASIQGTARIAQTLLTSEGKLSPTGKKIVMGGITLGLLQAVLLAMAGLDDDEVPDFVKDKSFVIPYGDGKYFAIPMPLGYNIIPGFGRRVMEFAMSDDKNVGKAVAETSGMIIDGFNPLGSATFVQTLTPTALDPFVALAENKDFTGKPISREDVNSLNPTPGYTRGSQNSFAITEALAYGINLLTGGTEFKKGVLSPTPDQIEYLVGEALGGVGREAMKIGRGVEALATGEELATYNIPIAGRLVGNVQQQAAQRSRFFENVRTLNEHQAEIEGRLLKGEDISEYIDQYPEASLYQVGDKIYNRITKLRQMRKVLEGSGADREQLKTVDEAILGLMTSLNEIYSSAKAQ